MSTNILEELRIIDIKLKNPLPNFDTPTNATEVEKHDLILKKHIAIYERKLKIHNIIQTIKSIREQYANSPQDLHKIPSYMNLLTELLRLKEEYTEKTKQELIEEKVKILETALTDMI